MKKLLTFGFITLALITSLTTVAQKNDIVDVAAGSAVHTTLVAAVKAAGLVEILKVPDLLRFLHQITMLLANCLLAQSDHY